MSQPLRFIVAAVIAIVLVAAVFVWDTLQHLPADSVASGTDAPPPAGSIPVYLDGSLAGRFVPADLDRLRRASFVDPAERVLQDGWLLRDVLRLIIDPESLPPSAVITVSSSTRGKSAKVTWADADNADNKVMFDLSNRGTLKLVSLLPPLDTRDEWVQDVDRIEITTR